MGQCSCTSTNLPDLRPALCAAMPADLHNTCVHTDLHHPVCPTMFSVLCSSSSTNMHNLCSCTSTNMHNLCSCTSANMHNLRSAIMRMRSSGTIVWLPMRWYFAYLQISLICFDSPMSTLLNLPPESKR